MKIGRASKVVVVAIFYKGKLVDRCPKFLRNWESVYESSKIGTEPSRRCIFEEFRASHKGKSINNNRTSPVINK